MLRTNHQRLRWPSPSEKPQVSAADRDGEVYSLAWQPRGGFCKTTLYVLALDDAHAIAQARLRLTSLGWRDVNLLTPLEVDHLPFAVEMAAGILTFETQGEKDSRQQLYAQREHAKRMQKLREAGLDETNTAAFEAQMKDAGR